MGKVVVVFLLALAATLSVVFAGDVPTNVTIGSLHVDNIQVTAQLSPVMFSVNATAWLDIPDAKGNCLTFDIKGQFGLNPSFFAFSGTQKGTWAPPFPTKDLTLDFLAISYNSTNKDGHISGGACLGKWSLEVDLNFVVQTVDQVGIGFIVTSANPSFNDLPSAPQVYGNMSGLTDVGVVIANYEGNFEFTSGAVVPVESGVNIFADAVFDGVKIHFKGKFWYDTTFHAQIEAEAKDFKLGDDITVQDTTVDVQFPDQPFLSVNTDMTWVDLQMHLVGILSTSSISFTGDAPGPWKVSIGSTPMVMTNMHVDMSYDFSSKQAQGELKATMQYGKLPAVTVIMKYPADSTSRGCFMLYAEIGDDAATLGDMMVAGTGNTNDTSGYPDDAQNLVTSPLKQLIISAYPNCDEFTFQATISTDNFGDVTFGFSLMKYAPLGNILQSFSKNIGADPDVKIQDTVTVDAKTVLADIGKAFQVNASDIMVAKAHVLHVSYDTAMQQIISSISSMRQQLLVQFTEHHVQVDALSVLNSLETALKGVSAGYTPLSYDGEKWQWEVHLSTTASTWPLSEGKELSFSIPKFAIASGTFQVTVGDTTIMAEKGLNFVVDLDISTSTSSAVDTLKTIDTCASQSFEVSGHVGVTDWFVQGGLTDGCISLGDDSLEISSTTLRIQHAEPQVSFDSVLTLPKVQSLAYQVDATVDSTTKTVHLSGHSQSVYHTKVGADPMDIDNLNLDLTWTAGTPPSWSASMSGAITLNQTTEVSVSTSFDSSSKDFTFSGTIHEDNPIYFANLFEILLGEHVYDEIPFPDSLKEEIGSIRFVEGSVSLDTGSKSFSASGQLEALDIMLVSFSFAFNDGKVSFGFSIKKDPYSHHFTFSEFIPTIKILDVLELYAPVAILSNGDAEIKIPGIDFTFDVHDGFTFGALLALNGTTPAGEQLKKWIGTDEIQIEGMIGPQADVFSLAASANVSFDLAKNIHLDEAGFFIGVDVPQANLQLGFDATASFQLSTRPQDTVEVQGKVFVSAQGAGFSAATMEDWVEPFGVKGLTVKKESISLTLGPTFTITQFGISGGLVIGQTQGAYDLYADAFDLAACIIAAEVDNIAVGDLISQMLGESMPAAFQDATLTKLALSLNPTGHTVTVAGKTFPNGIYVEGDLSVGSELSVDASALLDPTKGIDLEGHFQPFSFGSVLQVTEGDMAFHLLIGEPIELVLKTNTTFLNVNSACQVDASSSGLTVDIAFVSGVVDFQLACTTQTSDPMHPNDFSVSGDLNIGSYLSQQLPVVAKQEESNLQPQIDALQKKCTDLQNSINTLQAEIDARSQNDTEAKQKAIAAVNAAQQSVSDAQTKVNGIQSQIDDNKKKLDDCKSYDLKCKAKYEAIIAGLEVEMKTAQAALSAAQAVLEEAQKELAKIPDPDVDPQIIEWKAEKVADQGLLATAQASLSALQSTMQLAESVVSSGASALAAKELAFSSNSYLGLQKGANGDVHLTGEFLGKSVDVHVPMILTDAAGFVQNVWDVLKKLS